MPIAHVIDAGHRLVRSRLWGIVTEHEAWSSATELMSDPAFDPTFSQLADMREVTRIDVSSATVRELAVMPIFDASARRALVVASGLQRGIGRMTTSFAESGTQQIALFDSLADAERWLGLPDA